MIKTSMHPFSTDSFKDIFHASLPIDALTTSLLLRIFEFIYKNKALINELYAKFNLLQKLNKIKSQKMNDEYWFYVSKNKTYAVDLDF